MVMGSDLQGEQTEDGEAAGSAADTLATLLSGLRFYACKRRRNDADLGAWVVSQQFTPFVCAHAGVKRLLLSLEHDLVPYIGCIPPSASRPGGFAICGGEIKSAGRKGWFHIAWLIHRCLCKYQHVFVTFSQMACGIKAQNGTISHDGIQRQISGLQVVHMLGNF